VGFKKLDVKAIIEDKHKDQKFDYEYNKVENEYNLINEFIELRKDLNITQSELARRTGVSQQAISRIESEKHVPQVDTFMKILDGMGQRLTISPK
jgi:DNA-binding XRE family transcriptional regulator